MERKVSYIVALISDFAERFGLTTPQAYRYLALYKGIDFLDEFYDVEHTLSFDDAIRMWRFCAATTEGRWYDTVSRLQYGYRVH